MFQLRTFSKCARVKLEDTLNYLHYAKHIDPQMKTISPVFLGTPWPLPLSVVYPT